MFITTKRTTTATHYARASECGTEYAGGLFSLFVDDKKTQNKTKKTTAHGQGFRVENFEEVDAVQLSATVWDFCDSVESFFYNINIEEIQNKNRDPYALDEFDILRECVKIASTTTRRHFEEIAQEQRAGRVCLLDFCEFFSLCLIDSLNDYPDPIRVTRQVLGEEAARAVKVCYSRAVNRETLALHCVKVLWEEGFDFVKVLTTYTREVDCVAYLLDRYENILKK